MTNSRQHDNASSKPVLESMTRTVIVIERLAFFQDRGLRASLCRAESSEARSHPRDTCEHMHMNSACMHAGRISTWIEKTQDLSDTYYILLRARVCMRERECGEPRQCSAVLAAGVGRSERGLDSWLSTRLALDSSARYARPTARP